MMGLNRAIAAIGLVCAVALTTTRGARLEGDAVRGAKLFEECASCHTLTDENGAGPALHGLFNRKAAALEDFRYSTAMRNSGMTWTAETLNTFIADPQKSIPGNRMAYAGLTDPTDRADLVAYLLKATK